MPVLSNLSLDAPPLLLALLFGYALGSIPFGLVLTRLAGAGDVRAIGSGNIGATNVLRTGRKGLAAATLVLDALKGTLAVLVAARWGPNTAVMAAFGAFLGHLFPVWLGFRGGKGVATFLGLLIGLKWPVALLFALAWLLVAFLTRYSSLSALVASALTPLVLWIFGDAGLEAWAGPRLAAALGDRQLAELFLVLALVLWWKHRDNIRRLAGGREGRIGGRA